MYCDIHTDFILTPLFDIFKDGVNACAPLSKGIENSSLGEYFLQSLFLRLTGAQEQKMKCICWAIASNDYRYRYEYQNVKHYGECSDYSDKQEVYKDIVSAIKKKNTSFRPSDVLSMISIDPTLATAIETSWRARVDERRKKEADSIIKKQEEKGVTLSDEVKSTIRDNLQKKAYPLQDLEALYAKERKRLLINRIAESIKDEISDSVLSMWDSRGFQDYKNLYGQIFDGKQITLTEKELFGNKLQARYRRIIYDHRNKTAHNTMSYQKDIPSLATLASEDRIVDTYYFRFCILLLIDELFMLLFRQYREQELVQ